MSDEKKEKDSKPETSDESKPEPEDTAKEAVEEEKAQEEAAEETKKADEASSSAEASADKKEEAKDQGPEKSKAESKEEPKPEPKKEVKVSGKLADIIKDIESLSVLELADLVKALEDKFGVSAAPVAMAGGAAPAAGDGKEGPSEEQTTFNVILAEAGANKIGAIKAVREVVPTLGLKEAKDLVEAAPKPVLEGAGKDDANEAKKKLEAAGAKVELQ